MKINRVKYLNENKGNADFEIITIPKFFATRPKTLIERDFRLDFWILIYVTTGKGVHFIDFKEYPYTAGDLIVIPKNRIHSFRESNETDGYIININEPYFFEYGSKSDTDTLAFFETHPDKPILHINIEKSSTNRQLIDLLYKEYLLNDLSYSADLIKELFTCFIYSIKKDNNDKIRHFSHTSYKHYYEYRELVENNYTKLKTVDEYAKLMGLSKKTINAVCRECADISAKKLITNRIILETKRLLALGQMKNYEISDALGFDEPANMAGFFKKETSMSMSKFRNSCLSNRLYSSFDE